MARLDIERQKQLEPGRVQFAVDKIRSMGFEVIIQNDTAISFEYKGSTILLFPYSGWHTGKTIKDGRGLNKLLNQIKNEN